MIHTLEFTTSKDYYPINYSDYKFITNNFKPIKTKEDLIYIANYNYFKFTYYKKYNILKTKVNLNKLLDKDTIAETDFNRAKYLINKNFYGLFRYTYLGDLSRIDYKADIKTPYKDLYIKLIKKGCAKYKALKQYNNYSTSCYYNSASSNINIYDKEEELINNNKLEDIKKYEDIIRFEVQIKNDKLYQLYKNQGICRELINYFTETDRNYFLNYYLRKIIYNGDYYYYGSKETEQILSKKYKRPMYNKLVKFQKNISKLGITKTRQLYNPSTFNNYIKKLEAVNINPIPLPKNAPIKILKNPFTFTDENIYLLNDFKVVV